jgi:DNA polymerase
MEETAAALIPPRPTLPKLRRKAAGCTACHLHELGTQTVFGEGPAKAELMLVGEQPGAGIERQRVYLTNAVKHFKWTPRGGRRIHDTPNEREMRACLPWLRAEIEVVSPSLVVALGATAARALLGRDFRLTRHRGEIFEVLDGPPVTATLHPSAVLRGPRERREELLAGLADDLRKAAEAA